MRDDECKDAPITYVEGITFGPAVHPMLHAWNTIGLTGRTAIDWTLYARTHFMRYLGVPFTIEEHGIAMDMLEKVSPEFKAIFFSQENFPLLESYLTSVLIERRKKLRDNPAV